MLQDIIRRLFEESEEVYKPPFRNLYLHVENPLLEWNRIAVLEKHRKFFKDEKHFDQFEHKFYRRHWDNCLKYRVGPAFYRLLDAEITNMEYTKRYVERYLKRRFWRL